MHVQTVASDTFSSINSYFTNNYRSEVTKLSVSYILAKKNTSTRLRLLFGLVCGQF